MPPCFYSSPEWGCVPGLLKPQLLKQTLQMKSVRVLNPRRQRCNNSPDLADDVRNSGLTSGWLFLDESH